MTSNLLKFGASVAALINAALAGMWWRASGMCTVSVVMGMGAIVCIAVLWSETTRKADA